MSRVAPLPPPWSDEDTAGISSWGHPDRTYEPLLLVRVLQRQTKHKVGLVQYGSVVGGAKTVRTEIDRLRQHRVDRALMRAWMFG